MAQLSTSPKKKWKTSFLNEDQKVEFVIQLFSDNPLTGEEGWETTCSQFAYCLPTLLEKDKRNTILTLEQEYQNNHQNTGGNRCHSKKKRYRASFRGQENVTTAKLHAHFLEQNQESIKLRKKESIIGKGEREERRQEEERKTKGSKGNDDNNNDN